MNAKTNETETTNVKVTELKAASWNVHKPSDNNDETFRGFVASIAANGILQRIVCRRLDDGTIEVVDGHRRLDAARYLGWTEVPVEIHDGMDDEDAQARTITANIQRLDNDPLREAETIKKMMNNGKTFEQIAATLGKDAKYVARRARIINLTIEWRKWLDSVGADADTMEMIARHEKSLQDEVYEGLGIEDEGELDLDDIERAFERHMRKIDNDTAFDTEPCRNCHYNTATHGYLFAEDADECGRCQNASCFISKWNGEVDEKIEKLREKKISIKEVSNKWNIPNSWNSTKNKTKKNTIPYVYKDGDLKYLVFGEKTESRNSAPAMTEAEKDAARKIKKAHASWKKNRASAYEKIRRLLIKRETIEKVVDAMVSNDRFIELTKKKLTESYSSYVYDSNCQEIYDVLTGDGLADANCERMTSEEIVALNSDDPANIGNGEEA